MGKTGIYQKAQRLMLDGELNLDSCTYKAGEELIDIMCGDIAVFWIEKNLWERVKEGKDRIWIFETQTDITARLLALKEYGGPHEVHHD